MYSHLNGTINLYILKTILRVDKWKSREIVYMHSYFYDQSDFPLSHSPPLLADFTNWA